jgi:hypothetical protein
LNAARFTADTSEALNDNSVGLIDQPTAWHHDDLSFIGKNYFRVEETHGRCGVSGGKFPVGKH